MAAVEWWSFDRLRYQIDIPQVSVKIILQQILLITSDHTHDHRAFALLLETNYKDNRNNDMYSNHWGLTFATGGALTSIHPCRSPCAQHMRWTFVLVRRLKTD